MITLIYATIAIVFLVLVAGLLRKPQPHDPNDALTEKSYAPRIGNGRWLYLSERIFDSSDARWLKEELAFPKLAETLVIKRKRLAIRWLEALQKSFDEVVRTPEVSPSADPKFSSSGSWQLLWLTLRFKILVSYALFVVKFLGPYHRLIPSFSWVPFSPASERSFRRTVLAQNRSSD